MKQKNYIIKLLLKTWLGILCFSLLCTFCAVWLLFQNTKQSSYDNINIVYEGIFLTWAIIGVIMFSVGTFTLFLNYFPVIRYNNIYSFCHFFLYPCCLFYCVAQKYFVYGLLKYHLSSVYLVHIYCSETK